MSDVLGFMKHSFGRVFREKRIHAGLTQKQVAKVSKIRPETISRIEAGQGNPTLDTLMRLIRVVER